VLLAFTGAEALYADMGHFGRGSIRAAWFTVVLPGLALNYLGQGALLIDQPETVGNPFYLAFPSWALYPMVALATAATVIASQATITGAYSLTRQAIQLGFLPRMHVVQTSAREYGQIYIPMVNWTLLVLVLAAVFGFGDSSSLASAYGVSVTGTMMITTLLMFFVLRYSWGYPLPVCLLSTAFFFAIDAAFFSSALMKLLLGGWFPLVLGGVMFTAMLTWRRGRKLLMQQTERDSEPLEAFLETLFEDPPARVPGTAVFLTALPQSVPHALLHNLKHNKVLHRQVVFLTVDVAEVPWIPLDERLTVMRLGHGCWQLRIRFGFMNRPDLPHALELARSHGLALDMMTTSFFLSRPKIVASHRVPGMASWRERLFAGMARNAGNTTDYFNIPANRVIELGTRVEI
jgi:KUP system potassium uptake protein